MNIGIPGPGDVTQALGAGSVKPGDNVKLRSRMLEPLALIWIVHGFGSRTGGYTFKLFQK